MRVVYVCIRMSNVDVYMYMFTYMCICMYACMVYKCMYVRTYAYVYVCVCMYICIYIYTCIQCTHAHKRTANAKPKLHAA